MNSCVFMGRLTADCEKLETDNTTIVKFRFVVDRPYKVNGESLADFFNCVIFGKLAETFYGLDIGKGTKLLLSGSMQNNYFTDKNGILRYEDQFVVTSFEFCEPRKAVK